MTRRDLLWAAAAAPISAPRPNVIVILADDQGHGDLSAHGNPRLKTPHLDRLHGESVRLTNFHVAPMCTPTRAQLMTGRDALNTGAINVSSGRTLLRRDLPTLAGMFAAEGYRTGLFGKWHLGDNYPYRPEDRGFQESVWFPSSHIGSTSDAWNNDYFDDRYRHNGRLEPYQGYCTDVFFREATRWITTPSPQPFFAYVALNAPHGPLFVEDRYREPYQDLPRPLQSFFGMIANLDENVGRLEETLTKSGLRDNTIVIFFTDNGGTAGVEFYNSGMRGRKVTLWEGGHRVPCFLRWPRGGLTGGREKAALTQVQDLAPTLLDLCGLKAPAAARFDGVSLAPLLRGAAQPALADRKLVVQFSRMGLGRPQYGDACVLWKQWRLVGGLELYDIVQDPTQQTNVAAQHPAVSERLRDHYDQWWRRVSPRLDTFEPIHLGSPKANPVLLSPTEWADVFLDQGVQIRRAEPRNGAWHILVERPGEYTFTLRRWPQEVDVAIRSGLPAHRDRDASYLPGVAMPIARARIATGGLQGLDATKSVGPEDREVSFTARLPEGPNRLQTWFYDEQGRELSGAYFVYAEWKRA